MKNKKSRRPTAYDRGQHDLICTALNISPDPNAPGCTAYEGVCVLLTKLDAVRVYLEVCGRDKKARELLKYLNTHVDDEAFSVLRMYL